MIFTPNSVSPSEVEDNNYAYFKRAFDFAQADTRFLHKKVSVSRHRSCNTNGNKKLIPNPASGEAGQLRNKIRLRLRYTNDGL